MNAENEATEGESDHERGIAAMRPVGSRKNRSIEPVIGTMLSFHHHETEQSVL